MDGDEKSRNDVDDGDDAYPGTSGTTAFSFNREIVKEEQKDEGDLAVLADENVAVYNAAALEQGLLEQVCVKPLIMFGAFEVLKPVMVQTSI